MAIKRADAFYAEKKYDGFYKRVISMCQLACQLNCLKKAKNFILI